MGMFNTVLWECRTPLPDDWDCTKLQTKDFQEIFVNDHKVSEDGTLMISTLLEIEKLPKEKRPFPDEETGFKSIFGSLKTKTELRPSNLTGYINLYGYEESGKLHDYMAKFKDGKLVKIIMREEYLRLIADV